MKKFFVVCFALILSISMRLYAQPGISRLSTVDSANLAILTSAWGLQSIENLCHAVPDVVFQGMKYERVKKYKQKKLYVYYYPSGKNDVHSPVKGELMLSYGGKYFYSVDKHAFVAKYSNPYAATEKKAKNKETLRNIANSPTGQMMIGAATQMIQRGIQTVFNQR